jgi:hypothetical protein
MSQRSRRFILPHSSDFLLSQAKCDINLSEFEVPSASQPHPTADERDVNLRHEGVPQQQYGTLKKPRSVFHLQVWWTCHKVS